MSRVSLGDPTQRHRPSPSLITSIIALVFSMSGTAYAATGGTFLIGKANTASTVTALTNSSGTALSLTAPANKPPLTVSNGTQIPNLNASQLGGQPASAFLPATGRAADSSKLGGVPASGFMQGNGRITGARLRESYDPRAQFPTTFAMFPGGSVAGFCDTFASPIVYAQPAQGDPAGTSAQWWNVDGVRADQAFSSAIFGEAITPDTTSPRTVILHVDTGAAISTLTITATSDSASQQCVFTAQIVTTNG